MEPKADNKAVARKWFIEHQGHYAPLVIHGADGESAIADAYDDACMFFDKHGELGERPAPPAKPPASETNSDEQFWKDCYKIALEGLFVMATSPAADMYVFSDEAAAVADRSIKVLKERRTAVQQVAQRTYT